MSKKVLTSYTAINAVTMAGDITQTAATNIQFEDNVGVQFNFTGTPTGTFFVDVSIDNTNWTPLVFSASPVASGSAGTVYCDINQVSAPWMRLRYVRTSGTGSLTALITAKEV